MGAITIGSGVIEDRHSTQKGTNMLLGVSRLAFPELMVEATCFSGVCRNRFKEEKNMTSKVLSLRYLRVRNASRKALRAAR
jgi:hypothetical protein